MNFTVAEVDGFHWPDAAYDGVAAIFVQFADPATRARLFARIVRSLKPGGVLILQGYTPKQLEYRTGGPPILSHLYTRELLEAAFANLTIIDLREYEAEVQEGQGHSGRSALIGSWRVAERMADRTSGGDAAEWAGRLLVALQFGLLALMGWRAWVTLPALGIPAGALLFGSAGMALWTLAVNRPGNFNNRPTPRKGGTLVTSGPYHWIRHPMYTSVLLAAAGAAVMSNQVFDAVLWLGLLTVLVVKAGIEERALMVRFPSYRDYKTQTTRFVPWLV